MGDETTVIPEQTFMQTLVFNFNELYGKRKSIETIKKRVCNIPNDNKWYLDMFPLRNKAYTLLI